MSLNMGHSANFPANRTTPMPAADSERVSHFYCPAQYALPDFL